MALIKIKCLDCDRIVDYEESEFDEDSLTCRECGGYFEELSNESIEDSEEDLEKYTRPDETKEVQHLDDDTQHSKIDVDAKTRFD